MDDAAHSSPRTTISLIGLKSIHVCGYDEEDGRCRHPDKVGEIGDIHPPRYLVAHVCHDQPLIELTQVVRETQER